jgi:hypothetical protein
MRRTARAVVLLLLLVLAAGAAAAYPRSPIPAAQGPGGQPPASASIGKRAASIAKRYLGVPYKWGGSNPKQGFDCSGLTMYVYAQLGIQLLHYSGAQWKQGYRLTPEQRRPGDLVFFHRSKGGPQHEGIYIGDGKFIHAPHSGDVVKISKLTDKSYRGSYVGAVRPYGYGPRIIFPVVGKSQYTNDYRGAGTKNAHEAITIIAARKALAVAPEEGRVKLGRSNTRAGCMLFLYGKSRTTYVYRHLNNDASSGNDNAGGCTRGIAYAPGLRSGSIVKAGELVGFVGDSGSANGVHPYLDFELRPFRGSPVNPYPYLNRGMRLLFAAPRGRVELSMRAKLVSAVEDDPVTATVKLKVSRLRVMPGGYKVSGLRRTVTILVSDRTVIEEQDRSLSRVTVPLETLTRSTPGRPLIVRTIFAKRGLNAQLGRTPFNAARVVLLPEP